MSFKTINSSDNIITPYVTTKQWGFNYVYLQDNGIKLLVGTKPTSSFDIHEYKMYEEYPSLVYNSINNLYYQEYSGSMLDSGSLLRTLYYEDALDSYRPSGSYERYLDETFAINRFPTGSGEQIRVMSIPKEMYGNKITPGSFNISSSTFNFQDDKNNNVFDSLTDDFVGNIFYEQGLFVITNQDYLSSIGPIPVENIIIQNQQSTGINVTNINKVPGFSLTSQLYPNEYFSGNYTPFTGVIEVTSSQGVFSNNFVDLFVNSTLKQTMTSSANFIFTSSTYYDGDSILISFYNNN